MFNTEYTAKIWTQMFHKKNEGRKWILRDFLNHLPSYVFEYTVICDETNVDGPIEELHLIIKR